MKKPILFILFIVLNVFSSDAQELWEQSLDAWDSGKFVTALEDFKKILNGPMADDYFQEIALITGELYKTTEISKDGRSVKFSPGGRYISYESDQKTIHIIDIRGENRAKSEFEGKNVLFSPDESEVVFLRVQETSEVKKIRRELEELIKEKPGDRRATSGKRREVAWIEALNTKIFLRNIDSGKETLLRDGGLLKMSVLYNDTGSEIIFVGRVPEDTTNRCDIYAVGKNSGGPRLLTSEPGLKGNPVVVYGGKYLIYSILSRSPFPRPPSSGTSSSRPSSRFRRTSSGREFVIFDIKSGETTKLSGSNSTVSADGSTLAYTVSADNSNEIFTAKMDSISKNISIKKTQERIESVKLSPDGENVVYSIIHRRNYDVFTAKSDGSGSTILSGEIQHDRQPRFISNSKILYAKGERRHSRSYIYDMESGETIKLFHNNTIRTIAPEYEWSANSDGTKILIQAERDGDTISPERSVFLVDLTQKITKENLLNRINKNLTVERALRIKGEKMFRPIFTRVKETVEKVSLRKIYNYEEILFGFDSKYISQPGNKPAGDYIFNTLKSFGYEPEYQWFMARNDSSANILAKLPGTENPELIYVLSSHYDSNRRSPGADDNSSAVAVLLETARILKDNPMPATIIFAAFTGEEAGLLGSRHFVAEAVKNNQKIVGALNNDMIGWANDFHLDNTIRYSNAGIRDVQHAGAFLFSKMITYDAHYYKSTDAAAYYDEFGDIVGGLGSYPVLGNPYYHQPTDLLETVNHQLLYEAAKANTAALMLLASSPSRLNNLTVKNGDNSVSWQPSPEKSVSFYCVRFSSDKNSNPQTLTVNVPNVNIKIDKKLYGKLIHVGVKAVNSSGLEGWDWAEITTELK